MKNIVLGALVAGLTFSTAAQQQGFISPVEQNHAQGGFNGPQAGLSTVAQAKTFRDDTWVVLEGNITRQIGDELYEFRDDSGTIYVDIDDKRWQGQAVTPASRVRIEGEVDKDWNSVEIDVKNVRIVR